MLCCDKCNVELDQTTGLVLIYTGCMAKCCCVLCAWSGMFLLYSDSTL